MTTRELQEHLEKRENRYRRRLCDLGEVRIREGRVCYEDLRLEVSPSGLDSVCRHVGAPAHYLAALPRELFSGLLEHHIGTIAKARQRMVLIHEGARLIGLARADLVRLEPAVALDAVIRASGPLADGLEIESFEEREDGLRVDLVAKGLSHDVSRGDVLKAGIRFSYSDEGRRALWVESFVVRLVCSNGLTHRECRGEGISRTRRLRAEDPAARQQQIDQTRRLAERIWASLAQRLRLISELRNERFDVPEFLARWLGRAHLSSRGILPILLRAWESDGREPTAYGAMNALTHAATHNRELSSRQRHILGRLAGILAFRRQHLCPRCFSVLRSGSHGEN